jgi:hypothetical protein
VELITERVASGFADDAASALFVVDSPPAVAQRSTPQLALFLRSFLQRQRGGDGEPTVLRAARRLGPDYSTARIARTGDGWLTSGSRRGASLYQLRLGGPHLQQEPLFSPGHLLGPTLRVADSFDVDVDIEILPVEAGKWLALPLGNAVAEAHATLGGAAQRGVSFHAAARAWTCAHRHLLLGLFAMQLALTTLIFLAVHMCPAAAQQEAADCGVVSAAAEVRSQLSQPLLPAELDVDATNPLHGLVVMIKNPMS